MTDQALGTSNKRKRRRDRDREKLEQYGVDLPEIPGLPVAVVPLHVFALKRTVASIKHDFKQESLHPFPPERQDGSVIAGVSRTSSSGTRERSSFMDHLMDRVEEATTTANTTDADIQQEQEIRQRDRERQESIDSWLTAIHREIRDCKKGSEAAKRVPVSALKHLWGAATDHKSCNVRRAALHMSGHLLQKSSDARRWLLEDTKALSEWLDAVVDDETSKPPNAEATDGHPTPALRLRRLWQRESKMWIKHFLDAGYGDLYPSLFVALQRIEQNCPWVREEDESDCVDHNLQNMQTWRSWRDLALENYQEEDRRVSRLIRRCVACFDVLAPRLDAKPAAEQQTNATKTSPDNSENESDEEDVDWEDGWEDNEFGIDDAKTQSHKDAVEHTINSIQATSAIENGQLEIDMRAGIEQGRVEPDVADESEVKKAKDLARKRLTNCIEILNQRHLPRLTRWIDGLTKADLLVEIKETRAMARMNNSSRQSLELVLQACIDLKGSIVHALSTAQKLKPDSNRHVNAAASVSLNQPNQRSKKSRVPIRYKPQG